MSLILRARQTNFSSVALSVRLLSFQDIDYEFMLITAAGFSRESRTRILRQLSMSMFKIVPKKRLYKRMGALVAYHLLLMKRLRKTNGRFSGILTHDKFSKHTPLRYQTIIHFFKIMIQDLTLRKELLYN
jgi:hypothetical protein